MELPASVEVALQGPHGAKVADQLLAVAAGEEALREVQRAFRTKAIKSAEEALEILMQLIRDGTVKPEVRARIATQVVAAAMGDEGVGKGEKGSKGPSGVQVVVATGPLGGRS